MKVFRFKDLGLVGPKGSVSGLVFKKSYQPNWFGSHTDLRFQEGFGAREWEDWGRRVFPMTLQESDRYGTVGLQCVYTELYKMSPPLELRHQWQDKSLNPFLSLRF